MAAVEALLKAPGRILFELRAGRTSMAAALVMTALVCLSVYGVVVGSLSGGSQLWIAPAKILLGSAICVLICLPSLYIFLCLSGAEVSLKGVSGELLAMVSLMALLLPRVCAGGVGLFTIDRLDRADGVSSHRVLECRAVVWGGDAWPECTRFLARKHEVWMILYVVVCLQMMTSLRPIIGASDSFLPKEKSFPHAHG